LKWRLLGSYVLTFPRSTPRFSKGAVSYGGDAVVLTTRSLIAISTAGYREDPEDHLANAYKHCTSIGT
jgi:hypothetical protein